MYPKQQATVLKKQFWTRFGQYLRPINGAAGEQVNWLNYKTGKRHLYFRMDVNQSESRIAVEFRHPDDYERSRNFQLWRSLENLFRDTVGKHWTWEADTADEDGNRICRISESLHDVSIFRESDWPAIISFLKPRILALDEFWEMVKDGFE